MIRPAVAVALVSLTASVAAAGNAWDCMPARLLIGHWEVKFTQSSAPSASFVWQRDISPGVRSTTVKLTGAKVRASGGKIGLTSRELTMTIDKAKTPPTCYGQSRCALGKLSAFNVTAVGPVTSRELARAPWACWQR